MTLVPGNIGFMWIFLAVPRRWGIKHSGVLETSNFSAFRRCSFGTLENKANIMIEYYLVPRRLSNDPKTRDLE